MSRSIEVNINGESFPCRMTMGAMLRFKRETGRDVTEADLGSLSDLAILLYCCTASASKADGREFRYTLEEFADSINEEDMTGMTGILSSDDAEGKQKKSL